METNGFKTKNLWKALGVFLLLEITGALGFVKFAGLTLGNASYESFLIIITHIDHYGFTDTRSRWLIIFLTISSLVLMALLIKWFADYIMGFNESVRHKRMKQKIAKMSGHYIVCGLGRVGSQVMRELKGEGVAYVGIDRDKAQVEAALKEGHPALQLDTTEDGTLEQLNIMNAEGLVACLATDSENLIVTLAARSLNPNLYIVARANRKDSETKLHQAGADRVAMPYQIGGYHMATMVLRPNVVDYLDVVNTSASTSDLQVEEMVVGGDSELAGHRLDQVLTPKLGATVIAINGADGASHVRPTGKETIYPGDRLIILGAKKDLTEASSLIRG